MKGYCRQGVGMVLDKKPASAGFFIGGEITFHRPLKSRLVAGFSRTNLVCFWQTVLAFNRCAQQGGANSDGYTAQVSAWRNRRRRCGVCFGPGWRRGY